MPNYRAEMIEIRLEPGGASSGQVRLDQPLRCEPGQYLLAQTVDDPGVVPRAVFPCCGEGVEWRLAAPLPAGWAAGMELRLRGPLGSGFHLPPGARKVALAALDGCPQRLLPLVERTLRQGGDVALYGASDLPDHLPLAVEVLPLSQLAQCFAWADYLALDVPLERLSELGARLEIPEGRRSPIASQALVTTPMPCGGSAECGVCAVHTAQGWRLACKDGPVFDLDLLLER